MDACVLTGVTKKFKHKTVLDDCTVSIPQGAMVALVGSNGAGKSTLMSLVAGVLAPTSGSIHVNGHRVEVGKVPEGLAYLTQDRPLYRAFTVAEMIRATRALNRTWDEPYCRELIASAGIDTTQRIRALSGGQRSRVALALALARRPSVLLLDEPVSDLDPVARRAVWSLLVAETATQAMTTIISSHIVAELADQCDHLLLVGNGGIACSGLIDDLLPPGLAVDQRSKALEDLVVSRLEKGVPA